METFQEKFFCNYDVIESNHIENHVIFSEEFGHSSLKVYESEESFLNDQYISV